MKWSASRRNSTARALDIRSSPTRNAFPDQKYRKMSRGSRGAQLR